jgi:hypothetical protein
MSSYKFKYKKGLFSKTILAMGHRLDKDTNRMDVYHVDGSITSIAEWSKYNLYLGTDWVLFTKREIEKESGQKIELAVEPDA